MADDRIQRPNIPYTPDDYDAQNEAAFRREIGTMVHEVDAALLRFADTVSSGLITHATSHAPGGTDTLDGYYSQLGHTHVEADITDLQAYLLDITGEPLSDLSDVTLTAIASGELLKWNGSAWINNTLAEAGISEVGHTHTEAQITDLTHYTDGEADARIALANIADLANVTDASSAAGWYLRSTAAATWVAQLGLTEADVTAHEAALSITESQISDFGTYEDYLGVPASDGYVLSSTVAGTRSWIAAGGGVTDHGALTGLSDDDHSAIYGGITQAETISGLWEFDAGIDFGVSSVVWGQIYASSGPGLAIEGLADVTFIVDSNNNSTLNEFMWGTNAAATGAPTQLMRLTDEGALWNLLSFELGGSAPGSAVAKFGLSSNDMYLDVDGSFVVNLDSDNDATGTTFQIATNGVGTGGGSDRFVVEDTGEAWALLELTAGGTHSSPEFRISEDSLSDWRVQTISGKMTLEALGSTTPTGDGIYIDDGGTNNAKVAGIKNITSSATAPTGDYPYGTLHLIY